MKALRKPQFWFGFVMLAPLFAWYGVFSFGPILRALWMSTVDYRLLDPSSSPFVGLGNFRTLFAQDLFWESLQHTLTYAALLYMSMLPLALLISICLTRVLRGRAFYQTVIFLPVVVSLVAMSLLFYTMLDPHIGPVNRALQSVGLPGSQFLQSSRSAMNTIVGIDVWKNLGFYVVILTAGMMNIPQEMYDAAKVDGAGDWQSFRHITLPLLGHTLALICVLLAIGGLQVFTQVVVLPFRPGGPGTSTYVLNLLVYTEAFSNIRFGLATAASFVLFIFVFIVTLVQLRIVRPDWNY